MCKRPRFDMEDETPLDICDLCHVPIVEDGEEANLGQRSETYVLCIDCLNNLPTTEGFSPEG